MTSFPSSLQLVANTLGGKGEGVSSDAHTLAGHYKKDIIGPLTPGQMKTYVTVRMPATYAAVKAALGQWALPAGDKIRTALDLGAGPGTASYGLLEIFGELKEVTLVERDKSWAPLQKAFQQTYPGTLFHNIYSKADHYVPEQPVDVAVASYMLSEMEGGAIEALTANLYSKARYLIIVDTGTPKGFQAILKARTQWVKEGGHVLAPCPHNNACPLVDIPGDWCHFSTRLLRSAGHKAAKGASLPYEDEKYTYIILGKNCTQMHEGQGRIIKKPMKRKRHIMMDLCTPEGLMRVVSSKKEGSAYKRAQNAAWGDLQALPIKIG